MLLASATWNIPSVQKRLSRTFFVLQSHETAKWHNVTENCTFQSPAHCWEIASRIKFCGCNVFWRNEGWPFLVFARCGCLPKICWLRFGLDWCSLVASFLSSRMHKTAGPGCATMLEFVRSEKLQNESSPNS